MSSNVAMNRPNTGIILTIKNKLEQYIMFNINVKLAVYNLTLVQPQLLVPLTI
jgi:hypothetical protein